MDRRFRVLATATLLLAWGCGKTDPGVDSASGSDTSPDSAASDGQNAEEDAGSSEDGDLSSLSGFEDEGSGGGNTGDPDDNISNNCGEINVESVPLSPNIMLVIDKSGSMVANYWDDNGVSRTRWYSLHGIVSELLGELGSTVNFGLKYFPRNGEPNMDGCKVDDGVHVPTGPDNGAAILAEIPGPEDMFEGSTPTNSGLKDAVEFMKSLDDSNQEAIILVVDGKTTCGQSNQNVAKTAADAYAHEIPVYVVGVDLNLEHADVASLEEVALAGGTEKIYNSTDAAQLAKALETLIGDVGSCKIPLDPPPTFFDYLEVVIGGEEIVWLEGQHSCTGEDGWVFTGTDDPYLELELCGAPCDTFLQTGKADITYECPPPP